MKTTIKDIAQLANVSIATVSMIVNKKDERISAETRDKVLAIIKEHHYVPNRVASSMITKSTKSLGLILPDIANPFFPEVARGAEDYANEKGWSVFLCNSDNNLSKEDMYIEKLQEKMVDGIILTAANHRTEANTALQNLRIPIVTVDRAIDNLPHAGNVVIDNEHGAYEAVDYLLSRGYEKVFHLCGPLSLHTAMHRYNGYQRAHEERDMMPPPAHLLEGLYSSDWGYVATQSLLRKKASFDALFCGDDMIALGALKALYEHGVSVPEDVGIVGFDDIYLSQIVTPELTTVHQPIYELGYRASELIIDLINGTREGDRSTSSYEKKLGTSLKVRGTTR